MTVSTLCRHALETILSPFFIGVVLYAVLVVWFVVRGDHLRVRMGFVIVLIGFLVLSTAFLPNALFHWFTRQYPVVIQVNPEVHWVVVLGGGQMKQSDAPVNHVLKNMSIRRVVEGVRLYRQLPQSKLILSGGGELNPLDSEAAHSATLAFLFGIPKKDIVVETASINTLDQAILIKKWVGKAPFYLVTSAVHLPRAMGLFHKQGLNPIAAPADSLYESHLGWNSMIPNPTHLVTFNTAWHEVLGSIWARIRGVL
jgi:uncharacterized SAM-binding protein YcdF (DUF218 family)